MTSYNKRFVKIIEHIEDNLDTPLDTNQLCTIANLSRYHFHLSSAMFCLF